MTAVYGKSYRSQKEYLCNKANSLLVTTNYTRESLGTSILGYGIHIHLIKKPMTNPVEIIKRDHRAVEKMFKEYEELGDRAFETKRKIVDQIIEALTLHTEMEEVCLYPKLTDTFNKEGDKMVEEAYAEHQVAKRLLEELSVIDPQDPQFDAKVKVLSENISHHVKEEEEELLPKTEKELKEEELNAIGEQMKAFKLENGEEM